MEKVDENSSPEVSIVVGGALYQAFSKLRLLRPPLALIDRRIMAITVFTWLPLLILTLIENHTIAGTNVPFFLDFEVQIRFLIALPLLIVADLTVYNWVGSTVDQFLKQGIIRQEDVPRFNTILGSMNRCAKSVKVEIFLFIFVLTAGHYVWSHQMTLTTETWFTSSLAKGSLSLAGFWYVWVSLPFFQFILCRWFYRIILWGIFLFRVSRLNLDLNSLHPDRCGGIGFLQNSIYGFTPFVISQGALISGLFANRIFHEGAHLADFKFNIGVIVALMLFLVLGPLMIFHFKLFALKRRGILEYGLVATKYVHQFNQKWIRFKVQHNEPILGTSDIQSLADLSNSFQVINEMKYFPFGKQDLIRIILLTILPILPLVLTILPLDKLLKMIIQTIL